MRAVYSIVRLILAWMVCGACCACAQDAQEIVRRSIELDQTNWVRMADYTWEGRSLERHFDSHNRVTSRHSESWDTIVLDGQTFRRTLERDGKPVSADEQRRQQQKLDKAAARLEKETPEEKQRQAADVDKARRRERQFLLEVPDAFNLTLEGSDKIDGRDVWVISGVPKPGYHAKSRDGAALAKIRGKIWIDKESYQWVRLQGETIGTISFGLFLARLNPGARLEIDQTRVNGEVWLPKREYMTGTGRIGLLKRVAEDDEITWSDYKKFHVDSKVVAIPEPK